MRSTQALINLKSLQKNFLNIRQHCGTKVLAVVKADAYGHGMVHVVEALNELKDKKPDYFAVAIAEEAEELRLKTKAKQPVLVFDPFNKYNSDFVFKYNLNATVFEKDQLNLLIKTADKNGYSKPINIHVKINTGMNRLGVDEKDAIDFLKYINAKKRFKINGIYTHFATSDEYNKDYAHAQFNKFKNLLNTAKQLGINYGLAHCANSGAILDLEDTYLDMVRPGIILYGYYPSFETKESIKLNPVMSVTSYISSVRTIKKGETVSYGRKFRASHDTNIATIPIGYADGIYRSLSNKMKVIIKDKEYQQIGTVTMDRIMVNLNHDTYKPDEKVIIIGKSKSRKIDAWDLSKLIDTIPYEICCNINKRIPRIYKK